MIFTKFLSPKIRIHIWGGLGSQLYGVALSSELKSKLPRRESLLVCHTSGVTKRLPEIEKFAVKTLPINDFERNIRKTHLTLKWIVKFFKVILSRLKIVVYANSQHEFESIRPWVLSIRGHYTKVKFSQKTIAMLYDNFNLMNPGETKIASNTLSVHYRLGDLLSLSDKNPIEVDSLISKIEKLVEENKISKILVYSDSIDFAVDQISIRLPQLNVIGSKTDSHSTISECIKADYFMGTNSKISLWISVLRQNNLFNTISYLPISMKNMVEVHLKPEHKITYY